MEFRWLGVAGFELEWNGSTLLVDPFLTRPPLHKLWFGRTQPDGALLRRHIPQADFILVSHAHYDHLLDVPEIAKYTGARVYGSAHTCQIAEACGLRDGQASRIKAGDVLTLPPGPPHWQGEGSKGEFTIDVLAGEHTQLVFYGPGKLPAHLSYPLRLRDFVLDETFSFRIQAGGTSLLAWHNVHPRPAPPADILLLIPDVLLADLPELLDQVRPRLLIPIHWDNFFEALDKPLLLSWRIPTCRRPWLERADPWELKHQVARLHPGVEVWVPGLFERKEL